MAPISTSRSAKWPEPADRCETFTLETWFKRTGWGGRTTGGGGFENATTGLLIPLISKGRAQSDGSNIDTNYILGINDQTGVLIADFEDLATGLANHPVSGITPIPISTTAWHHTAVTYDGTTWNLYLDGALEKTLVLATSLRGSIASSTRLLDLRSNQA